jgi:hypothetical protein
MYTMCTKFTPVSIRFRYLLSFQQSWDSNLLLGEVAILTPSALPDDTGAVGPKPPQ